MMTRKTMTTSKAIVRARGLALTLLLAATFSLALPRRAGAQDAEETVVIQTNAPMKYFKGQVNPPAGWSNLDFDDSAWLGGKVPCGYGETFTVTPAWTVFSDMRNSYLTMYVRIPFELPAPERLTELRIKNTQYDDGFVAYVNGLEVARASMPAGNVTKDTAAIEHEYSVSTFTARLNTPELLDLLEEGTNVLAVELHNTSLSSSDLVFNPTLSAFVVPDIIPEFIRGVECDGQPALDIGDPIYILRWQLGGFYDPPGCPKACDSNDDGKVDMSDAVYALEYLFLGGPAFPPPYPGTGPDPTADELTCPAN